MTPIKDYALIGNCETAALVNARGGIDWLCMPVFDSPALFAALLDDQKGGSFVVRPTIPFQVEREYHEDSAILVTRFVTGQGTVALTDFFVTARSRDTGPLDFTRLHSTRKLVRLVEWEEGSAVPMEVLVEARPSFARGKPNWREAVGGGFESEEATLFSNTPLEMRGSDLYAQFATCQCRAGIFRARLHHRSPATGRRHRRRMVACHASVLARVEPVQHLSWSACGHRAPQRGHA